MVDSLYMRSSKPMRSGRGRARRVDPANIPLGRTVHYRLDMSRSQRLQQAARVYFVEIILAVALIVVGVLIGWQLHVQNAYKPVVQAAPAKPAAAARPKAIAPPVAAPAPEQGMHIAIASLGINAPVVEVGETAAGNMEIPDAPWVVGLYKNGPKPGEEGNSVLAGHLGAPGQKSVFTNLVQLKVGDIVMVGEGADKIAFRVTNTLVTTPAAAPLNDIFGPVKGAHLNLITCAGTWDGKSYDQRLVVFTERVSG